MAEQQRRKTVTIEDARVMFRNFSGKEGTYNKAGDRNFVVFIDDELAQLMVEDDWNVKVLKPREEDDSPQAYIEVAVNFKGPRPPRVVMITSRGRTNLGEEDVNILDWAEIENVDLIITPYHWNVNGKTGVKAYLQSFFVTIREDELDLKYAGVPDAPDSAQNTFGASFEFGDE